MMVLSPSPDLRHCSRRVVSASVFRMVRHPLQALAFVDPGLAGLDWVLAGRSNMAAVLNCPQHGPRGA